MALASSDGGQGDQGDQALVEAHRSGDPEAFTEIVRLHYPLLLAQAERRLRSRSEAEDVVQEVFERALKAIDRFGGEFRLAAWLSTITSHVCADHGSYRSAQRRLSDRFGRQTLPADDPTDSVHDPKVTAAVQAAVSALPASQRSTFVLHAVDGYSYPEVADRLGISEANARARVHRAKTTLRRRLEGLRETIAGAIGIPTGMRLLGGRGRRPGPGSGPIAAPGRASGMPRVEHLALAPGGSALIPTVAVQQAQGCTAVQACATQEPVTGQGVLNLPQLAGQLASRAATTPLGQVLAAVPPAAPKGSLLAGLAMGIAVASAPFAAPLVGSGAPPAPLGATPRSELAATSAALRPSRPPSALPTAPGQGIQQSPATASTGSVTTETVPTGVTTPRVTGTLGRSPTVGTPAPASWESLAQSAPATTTAAPTRPSNVVARPGDAPSERGDGGAATTSPTGTGSAAVLPGKSCPWLSSFSGGGPGQALSSDALGGHPVSTLQTRRIGLTTSATDPVFTSSGSIGALSTGTSSVPVTVLVGACLPPLEGALVVDVTGPGGAEVQLQGTLIMVLGDRSDAGYLFRGDVVSLVASPSGMLGSEGAGASGTTDALPWGVPSHFIAQLQISEPSNAAQLQIAFLGTTPAPAAGPETGTGTTGTTGTSTDPSR